MFYGVAVASTFVMTTSPLFHRLQSPSLLIRSRSVWSASLPTKPSPLLVKFGRFDSQLYCHWSQKQPHRDPTFFFETRRYLRVGCCIFTSSGSLPNNVAGNRHPLLSRTPRQRALQRRQRKLSVLFNETLAPWADADDVKVVCSRPPPCIHAFPRPTPNEEWGTEQQQKEKG